MNDRFSLHFDKTSIRIDSETSTETLAVPEAFQKLYAAHYDDFVEACMLWLTEEGVISEDFIESLSRPRMADKPIVRRGFVKLSDEPSFTMKLF
jgi:hypothetical protein